MVCSECKYNDENPNCEGSKCFYCIDPEIGPTMTNFESILSEEDLECNKTKLSK